MESHKRLRDVLETLKSDLQTIIAIDEQGFFDPAPLSEKGVLTARFNHDVVDEAVGLLAQVGLGATGDRLKVSAKNVFDGLFNLVWSHNLKNASPDIVAEHASHVGPFPIAALEGDSFDERQEDRLLILKQQATKLIDFVDEIIVMARKGKQKGGRPSDTDPTADANIRDEWETFQQSGGRKIAQFAAKGGLVEKDVRSALDRARKRK